MIRVAFWYFTLFAGFVMLLWRTRMRSPEGVPQDVVEVPEDFATDDEIADFERQWRAVAPLCVVSPIVPAPIETIRNEVTAGYVLAEVRVSNGLRGILRDLKADVLASKLLSDRALDKRARRILQGVAAIPDDMLADQ